MAASPFSLRPWPTGDKKPKNLAEFVARVHAEPGGFRSVTEDKLRDDIKALDDTAGLDQPDSSSSDDDSDDGDDETKDDEDTKDAIAARDEFFRSCDHAHQSAMLALDAISLLLSKEMPVQAGTTLSTALRDAVGIGTLGASKLHDSNVTEARTKNDLTVATGWRVMGLNKMVDSVMAAAERLEKEMELEAKYWADVLAVSDKGWAVCSLPQDQHTLGVRFGFSEAAPEFRDQSLAPLRRQDDGTVRLDTSRVGRGSQRIRVSVERNGGVTAQSRIPRRTPDDAPLPDRVLEARNTAFSQELWYELNREARTLLSYGVQMTDTEVTYQTGPDTKIILTLHDLVDEQDEEEQGSGHKDHDLANSVTMVLHFLLSFAHRQNYRTRTQISTARAPPTTPPYSLLRPLIARTRHISTCDGLARFLGELVSVLQRAGVSTASYTMTAQPVAIQPHQEAQVRRASKSEILSANLISSMDLQAELVLTSEARLNIRGRTFMQPWIGQQLRVLLAAPQAAPPSSSSTSPAAAAGGRLPATTTGAAAAAANPLESSYPPSGDAYPDLASLTTYLRNATLRALSHNLAANAAAASSASASNTADIGRSEGFTGPVITADHGNREVRLSFVTNTDIVSTTTTEPSSSSSAAAITAAPPSATPLVLQCEGQWRSSSSSLSTSSSSSSPPARKRPSDATNGSNADIINSNNNNNDDGNDTSADGTAPGGGDGIGNGHDGAETKTQRWTWTSLAPASAASAAAGGGGGGEPGSTTTTTTTGQDRVVKTKGTHSNTTGEGRNLVATKSDRLEAVVVKILVGRL
ncbi:subunit 17 of mediator complex-domain-containing protein [Microdochium trichocladiopsis]|uniref:Mediator of RNA polymerase II transcription subunit 17 n=1 Tax=Microdochium trichocladiopsis TaxID=1682393 RepID=A0A9P8YDP6_9PEZI|nr:subunit 17 of mediator complex-domain-containing protein [Microdochium trichocladiopsis]KAH7037101.1 subunit 17 of mediator complex-domain-containing protein [Microdochium trichocladiopsis]